MHIKTLGDYSRQAEHPVKRLGDSYTDALGSLVNFADSAQLLANKINSIKIVSVIGGSNSTSKDKVDDGKVDPNAFRTQGPQAKGNAFATGTLMGELGPELVVSGGRYFVAGQNGPEMVNLADDAIVFNHLQTRSLLEKGMSPGRGQAVTNERNAISFAKGNINGGPAQASASQALSALRTLRAQWKSLLDLNP